VVVDAGTVVVVVGGLVVEVVAAVVDGATVVTVATVVEVVVEGVAAVVEDDGLAAVVGTVVVASDVDVDRSATLVEVVSSATPPAHAIATRQTTITEINRRKVPTFVNADALYVRQMPE
jgi:hypothetical protein